MKTNVKAYFVHIFEFGVRILPSLALAHVKSPSIEGLFHFSFVPNYICIRWPETGPAGTSAIPVFGCIALTFSVGRKP